MILSPLAVPFQPSNQYFHNNDEFVIYNDGMPSMVPKGGEGQIIEGISEEALNLMFPPSAQDVAEMEACDVFVDFLASLSLLEDEEELARQHFGLIPKRWEARRKQGLVGIPNCAKGSITKKSHAVLKEETTDAIVRSGKFLSKRDGWETRHRMTVEKKTPGLPRKARNTYVSRTKPIHQPRKFS
jgi:hypothetical protein